MAKRKTISESRTRFEDGVAGKGPTWESHTTDAASDYETFFKPTLDVQNKCGAEVEKLSGYAALVAYASCMSKEMGK